MNEPKEKYGSQVDQIHPFFMEKREWSKVKDRIVGNYIACYLKTVHLRGRPIIIVDAFAGPGSFGDGTDGSPLIICKDIEKEKRRVGIGCVFADVHPAHRKELEIILSKYIKDGICEKPVDECSAALAKALEIGKGATLFFYLDPYGIKDLEFEMVKQIYERGTDQSTEVLINFNFRTFMRMSGNWNYDDTSTEVEQKVKKEKVDKINSVMGGDYWLKIITDPKLDKIQREDAVIEAYLDKIRQYFRYTFSIPVKEVESSSRGIPTDNLAKYHLIFGTRNIKAVIYMNDVANSALEPYFNQFKKGLLFEMTPDRYKVPKERIETRILELLDRGSLTRLQIRESIIPEFFMAFRSKDYNKIIGDLWCAGRLFADPRGLKKKNECGPNSWGEGRLFADPRATNNKETLGDNVLLKNKPWEQGNNE
jgi:three-Cys-motif partner protein